MKSTIQQGVGGYEKPEGEVSDNPPTLAEFRKQLQKTL